MNETAANKVITLLKRHYYATFLLLAGLFLLVLLRLIPFPEGLLSGSVVLERYAIMITIIVIPMALKLFADSLKKIQRPLDPSEADRKYKKLYYLRLYSIAGVTLMNILLYGFSRNSNFMWLTVVLFIIFLFCKPSVVELTGLSEPPMAEQQLPEEPGKPFEDE